MADRSAGLTVVPVQAPVHAPVRAPVRAQVRVKHRSKKQSSGGRQRRADPELDSIRPLAVTVEQAGKLLSVSRATMYKLVMRGDIDSFKVGNARRIAVVALERYVGVPFEHLSA